jgi:hypothetical protein
MGKFISLLMLLNFGAKRYALFCKRKWLLKMSKIRYYIFGGDRTIGLGCAVRKPEEGGIPPPPGI